MEVSLMNRIARSVAMLREQGTSLLMMGTGPEGKELLTKLKEIILNCFLLGKNVMDMFRISKLQ